MEDGLRDGKEHAIYFDDLSVLILVLVEDGLRGLRKEGITGGTRRGLNPCFSGGWSQRMEGV